MYQYSLDSFMTFFIKSISKAKRADNVEARVLNLRDALRMTIFTWVSRGLFERHKLIFLSQLAFNLMKRGVLGEENIINELHFQFLLRGPRKQVSAVIAMRHSVRVPVLHLRHALLSLARCFHWPAGTGMLERALWLG